jgi:hypothetical protein
VRFALAFCASGVLLALPSPAAAQVIDPSEIVEEKLNEVEDLAQQTTTTVNDVVDDTVDEVEETVDETQETVGEVVDETIGRPDGSNEPEPPASDPPSEDVADPVPNGTSEPKGTQRPETKVASVVQSNVERKDGERRVSTPRPFAPQVEVASVTDTDAAVPRLASPPVTPGEAAQRLAFPILMTGLVILFLFVQGRFDRRDPKLLFDVDVNSESLGFE